MNNEIKDFNIDEIGGIIVNTITTKNRYTIGFEDLCRTIKLLNDKREKAIELLNEYIPIWNEWHWDGSDIDIENVIMELLNILQNGSEKE